MSRRVQTVQTWLACLLLAGATVPLAGCSDEAYCFTCTESEGGGGTGGSGSGGEVSLLGGSGHSDPDIVIDPGCGDLDTILNCGECGNRCERLGAFADCDVSGDEPRCVYECADGRWDVNGDLTTDDSDGCEYNCIRTNDGEELCDGLDNDCNGRVDEGTDTNDDPNNCGACGVVCYFANAGAECSRGECRATGCNDGFIDLDADLEEPESNGCEYACRPTSPADEICDGVDNDCDGLVDDADPDTDLLTDPLHCGACGESCAGEIPNAVPACDAGHCVIGDCEPGFFDEDGDPETGCDGRCSTSCSYPFTVTACDAASCTFVRCLPGYWDVDGDTSPPAGYPADESYQIPAGANGCEYQCEPSHGGQEVCDGRDNDCDGLTDEDDPDVATDADPLNCGACGHSCAGSFANAEPFCADGECALGGCLPGYFDNDADAENGCEFSCAECYFANAAWDGAYCEEHGECRFVACLEGFYDYANGLEDGCEYQCLETNGGIEICDGRDNDCDSLVDGEDDDLSSDDDPLHCGACTTPTENHSCAGVFANSEPKCSGGICVLGDCLAGYWNADGSVDDPNGCEFSCDQCDFANALADDTYCVANGECRFGGCLTGYQDLDGDGSCEYECTPDDPPTEVCDGVDNDCDGDVDEDATLTPENCGGCGIACTAFFPGSVTDCVEENGSPTCVFVDCLEGYENSDGVAANGCEYVCTPDSPAVETCDGEDDDCNGIVDDVDPSDLPDMCTGQPEVEGECGGVTVCSEVSTGVFEPVCVRTSGPFVEVCDGQDNDCDGQIDEHSSGDPLPGVGIACGSDRGLCEKGAYACVPTAEGAELRCQGGTGPADDECDGEDNDCDGIVDNGEYDSSPCFGGSAGACLLKEGTTQCVAGGFQCVGGIVPAAEVCDDAMSTGDGVFDNDCDGAVDEGCWHPQGTELRLDDNGSSQGQHSTFALSATSVGDVFFAAYADRRQGAARIYGRVSVDAGAAWATELAITGSTDVEPFVFGRAGRLYLAYSHFSSNVRRPYVRAANAGTNSYGTWSSGVLVHDPGSNYDAFRPMGVVVATDSSPSADDLLAMVYTRVDNAQPTPDRDVYLAYSRNGGDSWPQRWRLNVSDNLSDLPVVASDGNGMAFIAWREKISGADEVRFRRLDMTADPPTLGTRTSISAPTGVDELSIVADPTGSVHVVWTDLRGANSAIYVQSATSCSAAFSDSECLDSFAADGVPVSVGSVAGDATSPSAAARDGEVVVVWEDSRSGAADIRANVAALQGSGFAWQAEQARVDVGESAGQSASLEPRVTYGAGDAVLVVWTDLRSPVAGIYGNVSEDGGRTFYGGTGAYSVRLDDFSTSANPVLAAAADSMTPFVLASPSTLTGSGVWVDFFDDTDPPTSGINGDVWTRRFRPSP